MEDGKGEKRWGSLVRQGGELAGDGGFVQVVADVDAQACDESRIGPGRGSDRSLVFPGERGFEGAEQAVVNRAAVLDQRGISGNLDGDQPLVVSKNRERLPRRLAGEMGQHGRHPLSRHLAISQAEAEKLTGELLGLFAGAHVAEKG